MEDIRIRKNKKLIKKALVNNCTNGLQDITVSRLCQLSGVSRTAFYSYYPGIYAIVEELRQEFLPFEPGHPNIELFFVKERVDVVLKNKKEYLFLLSNGVCRDLFGETVKGIIKDMLQTKDRYLSESVFEKIASFAVPGILGFFEYAIKEENACTEEEILKMYQIIETHLFLMLEDCKKSEKTINKTRNK